MLTPAELDSLAARDWTAARAGDDEPLEHGNGRPYTADDAANAVMWGKAGA